MAMACRIPVRTLFGHSPRGNGVRELSSSSNNNSSPGSASLGPREGRNAPIVVATASRISTAARRPAPKREEARGRELVAASRQPPATSNSVEVGEDDAVVDERGGAETLTPAGDDGDASSESSDSGAEESRSAERKEEGAGSSAAVSAAESSEDDVGKALSELRKARAAISAENPPLAPDFWRGVAEETRLIEWPIFSKVLGTTGVVLAMIVGSSVVLLTVNAILSATSDYAFNDPGFRSFAKAYLNLAF